jgi:hypothetical protein
VTNSLTSIIIPNCRKRTRRKRKEWKNLVTAVEKCVRELLGGFRMRKHGAYLTRRQNEGYLPHTYMGLRVLLGNSYNFRCPVQWNRP